MKKTITIALVVFAFSSSFAKSESMNNKSRIENKETLLKRIYIDFEIFGTHVYGWVDWQNGGIKHYDIYVQTGPRTYHYQGKMSNNENGETNIEGTLTDEKENVVEMSDEIKNVLIETHNTVEKENQ